MSMNLRGLRDAIMKSKDVAEFFVQHTEGLDTRQLGTRTANGKKLETTGPTSSFRIWIRTDKTAVETTYSALPDAIWATFEAAGIKVPEDVAKEFPRPKSLPAPKGKEDRKSTTVAMEDEP